MFFKMERRADLGRAAMEAVTTIGSRCRGQAIGPQTCKAAIVQFARAWVGCFFRGNGRIAVGIAVLVSVISSGVGSLCVLAFNSHSAWP